MTRSSYPYPFAPEEGPGGVIPAWAIIIILGLIVAVVVFLVPRNVTAPTVVLPQTAVTASTNPELASFERYQAAAQARTAAEFAARNPEVRLVEMYNVQKVAADRAAFIAENPEIRLFWAYNSGDNRLDSEFLAQNPEVGVFRRYQAAHR